MKKLLLLLFTFLSLSVFADEKILALLQPLTAPGSSACNPIEISMVRGELRNAFGWHSDFQVVTRMDVDAMLKEQGFQNSGLVDDEQRKEVGRMTGAQYICVSTITKYNTQLYIEAYLVDVETGKMTNPASQYINIKNDDYSTLRAQCEELAKGMLGELVSKQAVTSSHAGHEYVDLGLSVKWATCNVGASNPEEYGDYFAWGETQPKSNYDWSTYKWCNGSYKTLTKYNTQSNYGTVDNKTTLDLSDDAARANWGGDWRMPTEEERDELCDNCTWEWTTQNGVNGYKVTSNKNGNSIFLPAAGYRNVSSLDNAGSDGHYWSSSLHTSSPIDAYALNFGSDYMYLSRSDRYYGRSVRPVCQ